MLPSSASDRESPMMTDLAESFRGGSDAVLVILCYDDQYIK